MGRHVAEHLVRKDYEITGIIRPNTHPERVAAFKDKIVLAEVDLADTEALKDFLASNQFDIILHIGAIRGGRPFPKEIYRLVNIEATRVLLEYALIYQARFIFCSSVGVFGAIPLSLPANNLTPRQPDTYYHFTKIEAEKLVLKFVNRGLNAVIVRPSITYGEGDYGFPYTLVRLVDHHLLILPFQEIYIHLTNIQLLKDVFEKLISHSFTPGSAYIVADKSPVSLQELSHFIHQELHGKPYPSILKLPNFLFSWAAAFFSLIGKENWRTRFQLISRNWYYSIDNMVKELNIVPDTTIPAFKTVIDWYKGDN